LLEDSHFRPGPARLKLPSERPAAGRGGSVTDPDLCPRLAGWMAGTPGTNLLRELFDPWPADDAPTSP